jgi:hypothetical protein
MNIVERVKKILFEPKREWEIISRESTNPSELYKSYIIPLAAIGPVASIIGLSMVGISLPLARTFRLPMATAIGSAVVQYVLSLMGVYLLAWLIDFLAPNFSGEKNFNQALKLAAYSYTAGWLSGIFVIFPAFSFFMILGLYGLYLIYTGIPVLMKAPQEKALGYTVTVVIAAIVISVVISWVSRLFITYPMPM